MDLKGRKREEDICMSSSIHEDVDVGGCWCFVYSYREMMGDEQRGFSIYLNHLEGKMRRERDGQSHS